MHINWFTVIAQVVNFFVLVWLLKRFLYKPVLKAIDDREKKIASQIQDAEDKKAEAKSEQDEFKQKNDTFDQERKELMDKAIAQVKEEKQKLLEEARNEAALLRSKLDKALKEMQDSLEKDIAQKTQQEVFAIARKTLNDLASLSLEEQMAVLFTKRLNNLNKEEKKKFIEAFKSDSKPILVRSVFNLPVKQQTEIKSAVNEILGTESQFQFKTAPELISGIDLTSNGYKLEWSISEYLNSLQKSIIETMKKEKKPIEVPKKEPMDIPEEKTMDIPQEEPIDVPKEDAKNKPIKIPQELPLEDPKIKEIPEPKKESEKQKHAKK